MCYSERSLHAIMVSDGLVDGENHCIIILYSIIINVLLFIFQQVGEVILRTSTWSAYHGALVPADCSSRQNLIENRYRFPIVFNRYAFSRGVPNAELATNGKRTILFKSMRSNYCAIRKEEGITSFTSFSFAMRIPYYVYHIFI